MFQAYKEKACIQFEDKYEDIGFEKHSKKREIHSKGKKEHNKDYLAGSKDIKRV